MNTTTELRTLIENSVNIVITSHLGADPDAACSSLLLYKTLQLNYPDKKISVVLEEVSYGLDFIDSYSKIMHSPLAQAISNIKPELIIILDANNVRRCTREEEKVRSLINSQNIKLAVIDHHEPLDKDDTNVFINQGSPAVTQDVYDICFNQLKLDKPSNYASIAMTGIYSDTGGFKHLGNDHKKTFDIVNALIDDGANIEQIANKLSKITEEALKVLSKLIENTACYNDFTYSFLDDRDSDTYSYKDVKQAVDTYVNNYLRNVDGRNSGFVIYKDINGQAGEYKASLRSVPNSVNVAEIAKKLGGGGHKPAAGAQFKAKDLNDAINKVKKVVSDAGAVDED